MYDDVHPSFDGRPIFIIGDGPESPAQLRRTLRQGIRPNFVPCTS